MPNTLLTDTRITRKALQILHQKLTFVGSINRQYDEKFAVQGAKIGQQLKIRLPNQPVARTGRTYVGQGTTERAETLTVATQKGVDLEFYSDELTMDIDDFASRHLEPAMAVLAATIEADALSMAKDIYNRVGTPGTTPAAMTTVLQAGQKLTEYLAPGDPRNLLINPAANVAMVNALSSLFHAGPAIESQFRKGMIGKNVLGFDWYESTHVPVLTTGTRDNTTPIVGSITGNSLACTGFDASATVKKGDIFTIGSVYAVHPETKTAYSHLQQFTATADATADGSGNMTILISPEPIATGGLQNVDAAPQASAALTFAGTASTNYPMNLAYHRDAFAFVTADLEVPKGTDMAYRTNYDGISMRFVRDYDSREDQWISRFDVLFGFKTIRPQLAAVVWG